MARESNPGGLGGSLIARVSNHKGDGSLIAKESIPSRRGAKILICTPTNATKTRQPRGADFTN